MSRVGDCPRCGAPQGMIGWLCGHTGEYEHDMEEDASMEAWAKRMGLKDKEEETK